jgi:hypothetical protein
MEPGDPITARGSRRAERAALDAPVTITFEAGSIVGPGQNISHEGVYFTAEATLPVTVRVDGREVRGHLVRFESMGNGRIGVAIRFTEPVTEPVPAAD